VETPLLDLPGLASAAGVAQVLVKDEGRRALGSFKSLGGTYAGLRALARAAGMAVENLLDPPRERGTLPPLVTASAGNHGLAVAAAARFAGERAQIFLYPGVAPARVRRIERQGASIVWVDGTYDDAVDEALRTVRSGEGLLVADTSADPDDPAVSDIVAGYAVIGHEIRRKVESARHARPTHLFVQAGVGGLAASAAEQLAGWLAPPAWVVVVEPEAAACVAAALRAGSPTRIAGGLETSAGMLACGEASRPALDVLRRHRVEALGVTDTALADAVLLLRACGGPTSTSSGAAGLAGLATAAATPALRAKFDLDADSRVLVIVTEADPEKDD
jgi:diaminopropionate ammonia-lyase